MKENIKYPVIEGKSIGGSVEKKIMQVLASGIIRLGIKIKLFQ